MSEEFDARVEQMLLGERETPPEHWPALENEMKRAYESLTPERIDELMSKQRIRVAPEPMRYIPSKDEIRAFIREEVHRAIYPTAEMVNPHVHRRIEMTEESGDKWRGVLYKVEKEQE